MRVWHLYADMDYYGTLTFVNEDEWKNMRFCGEQQADSWIPLEVRFVGKKESDSPGLSGGVPVFSSHAVNALKELMGSNVEILPLICLDKEYYVINVIEVIDGIDYENSVYFKFDNSERIMMFDKYAFISERIEGKHIFKIKDEPRRRPFVSDEFRDCVLQNGLLGFRFDLVWEG